MTGDRLLFFHLLISLRAGRPRGRMVLSSPNRPAIFVCQSGSPKGLWRFTDSRIEASWLVDNGSSTVVIQFASTSKGQGSVKSLWHQLDLGQSLTEAAQGFAERSAAPSANVRRAALENS